MRIGFWQQWNKGSLATKAGNVIGDELLGESMSKALSDNSIVDQCELFAPNYKPKQKLDYLIYLNDTPLQEGISEKHILYVQNAYPEGTDTHLIKWINAGYNGYAFISNKFLTKFKQKGGEGILLPFGVDTTLFKPHPSDSKYECDVAYIGNDIKGIERTQRYLLPALKYNFNLYGNWQKSIPFKRYLFKGYSNLVNDIKAYIIYRKRFSQISKGKIPQEMVPVLYSNAKINLNCTHQDSVDGDVITLRSLEILACKGFLISDRVPIAEKLLSDCIVFTQGGNLLQEQIDYYLENPQERLLYAEAGYEYVHSKASIKSRMNELIDYLTSL